MGELVEIQAWTRIDIIIIYLTRMDSNILTLIE